MEDATETSVIRTNIVIRPIRTIPSHSPFLLEK